MARLAARLGYVPAARGTRASYWGGAALNRLTMDWVMGPAAADEEVKADARALRDRARKLRKDNPWAARYVQLQRDGIIGPNGMRMRALPGNSRGGTNEQAKRVLESAFVRWATDHADVAGRLTLDEHADLAVETWKSEGEHFVQLVPLPTSENPFGFALQALDADQIDEHLNRGASEHANEIRMGVELDRRGRRVAYHVWTSHPHGPATNRMRQRIPASQIIHLGTPTRPGQTRFVTPFAPVLSHLRHLEGLQEAVLIQQRTAACKMGFLVPNERYQGPIEAESGESRIQMEAEPGLIDQLPPGFDFKDWNPGQPGPEYDPFTRNVLRAVCAGLNVSYASLTGDQSQANFGSQRVAMTAERDGYQRDQRYFVRAFYQRVYAAWLEWAFLAGALSPLPAAGVDRYPATFQPRGFDWIDPEKDAQAMLLEVQAGVNSLTRVAASKGLDFEELVRERAREMEFARAQGVDLTLNQKAAAPASEGAEPAAPSRALRVVGGTDG